MRSPVLCLLFAAFTAPALTAQWGTQGPVSVETPRSTTPYAVVPTRSWRPVATDPGRVYLFINGRQAGAYCSKQHIYREYNPLTDTWSELRTPPADIPAAWLAAGSKAACKCCDACECGDPCPCKGTLKVCNDACKCVLVQPTATEVVQDFGMSWRPSGKETYTRGGQEINRAEAHAAVADNRLKDDSGFLRVTAISANPTDRQKVFDDFKSHPSLVAYKDMVLLQGYAPTDWAVARYGFKTDGRPTVYVQSPSGEVLHRQDNYDDGAEGLAKALRKIKPYNPAKDPDKRKEDGLPVVWPDWLKNPQVLLGGGVLVLLFFLVRLKKG